MKLTYSEVFRNCLVNNLMWVIFLPTWRMELFSSVSEKSNGYTFSGPTCFLPMIPEKDLISKL